MTRTGWAAAAAALWLAGQDPTASGNFPRVEPRAGEVRVWRGNARSIEKMASASRVAPLDRLGSASGAAAKVDIDGEIFVALSGVEAGEDGGLAVVRSERRLTLKLYRGRLLVESLDAELTVETPQGKAEGKSAYFLVEVTKESTRIVSIDGKLQVSNDLGGVEVKPGESAAVRKDKAPVKATVSHPAGEVEWASGLEATLNLIQNPGFEEGLKDWNPRRATGRSLVNLDTKAARSGKKSLKVDLPNLVFSDKTIELDNAGVATCALYYAGGGLKSGSRYLLRLWVRTEGYSVDGAAAALKIHTDTLAGPENRQIHECPRAEGEWRCARFVLTATQDAFGIFFPAGMGPYAQSKFNGAFWLDDVFLTPLPDRPADGK